MKRVIKVTGKDGDVQIELNAKITTTSFTRQETDNLVTGIAESIYLGLVNKSLPYGRSFNIRNTKIVS